MTVQVSFTIDEEGQATDRCTAPIDVPDNFLTLPLASRRLLLNTRLVVLISVTWGRGTSWVANILNVNGSTEMQVTVIPTANYA